LTTAADWKMGNGWRAARSFGAALLVLVAIVMNPTFAQETLTSVANQIRLGPTPLTIALEPDQAFASALREAGAAPAVLAIEGIEGVSPQPVRIKVFLNQPHANYQSSTDDPNYLGFIQLLPIRGMVRPLGHAFDLSPMRHLDPSKPIRVTLVPVVGTDSKPNDLTLHISRIYVRHEP
jgi:hypothetical protein